MADCTDYERHERVLECRDRTDIQMAVRFDDGCSGRLCVECAERLDVLGWPDLGAWVTGPADGLDLLELLQATTARVVMVRKDDQ